MKILVTALLILLLLAGLALTGLLLFGIVLLVHRLIKFERSLDRTMRERKPGKFLRTYKITDPYRGEGRYWKGQLHIHTTLSYDGKVEPEKVLEAYREAGYDFLAFTEHNIYTPSYLLQVKKPLVIPGIEEAYPWKILGHHYLRINARRPVRGDLGERIARTVAEGGIVALAHPSWRGGLGIGRWLPQDVPPIREPLLVEIFSRYSNSIQEDLNFWHYLLNNNPHPCAIWCIAADDFHRPFHLNRGWVMLKAGKLTTAEIIKALKGGSFYASSGPQAEFGTEEGSIFARTNQDYTIRFINSDNRVVLAGRGREMFYTPRGNEGFVRVEIEDDEGKRAWSQPFFLLPAEYGPRREQENSGG